MINLVVYIYIQYSNNSIGIKFKLKFHLNFKREIHKAHFVTYFVSCSCILTTNSDSIHRFTSFN